jgi:NADPH-dependent 2,4-dienoyl-CoA reductase/sulfur reductase-like enzyme
MGDSRKLRIVVVGGGAAGATGRYFFFSINLSFTHVSLAVRAFGKKLDPHKHELTLITARTHFAYLPAGVRLLVSTATPLETVFMSYDKVFDRFPGQLMIGKATSVEANPGGRGGKVILDSGDEVLYDVVVIATGSLWEGLADFPDDEILYKEFIEEWRNKFKNANNVVIVGGGAVGIGKTVFLFFTHEELLTSYYWCYRNCGRNQRCVPRECSSEVRPICLSLTG